MAPTVGSERCVSDRGGNNLRKYRLYKDKFEMEQYCKIIMPKAHRSAFAKFCMGVGPFRIETGRYEGLSKAQLLIANIWFCYLFYVCTVSFH